MPSSDSQWRSRGQVIALVVVFIINAPCLILRILVKLSQVGGAGGRTVYRDRAEKAGRSAAIYRYLSMGVVGSVLRGAVGRQKLRAGMGKLFQAWQRVSPQEISNLASWYIAGMALALVLLAPGCATFVPEISHYPQIQNPFPELSRVAVAPFFNQSDDATVDGRRFALAYYAELQNIPGFEVVPVGVVEEIMMAEGLSLRDPEEAQQLAQMLGVDAVVVGSVTDYSPYYPPRCGLRVEWYASDPEFGQILAGYGLPWGTPEEEYIPPELVYEAEMEAAKAKLANGEPAEDSTLASQSMEALQGLPDLGQPLVEPPPTEELPAPPAQVDQETHVEAVQDTTTGDPAAEGGTPADTNSAEADRNQAEEDQASDATEEKRRSQFLPGAWVPSDAPGRETIPAQFVNPTRNTGKGGMTAASGQSRPHPSFGKGSAFAPTSERENVAARPVMTHTRIYHGHDVDFTQALRTYVHFRDDQRFGEWQTYLQRSEDFIRFCCHLHLAELLTARGGGSQTRVVSEWVDDR